MGCVGRIAVFDDGRGRVSQCHDHFDVWRGAVEAVDRQGIGMLAGDSGQRASTIPRTGARGRSRATPEYRAALRQVVQTPPQSLGYGFSVWSVARLNEHLKRQTKISFSDDRLRAILHEEGFSFQRPKHTMKGKRDEAAYEKARRELKRLKKGRLLKLAMLS
jgi:transposase